MWNSIVSVPDHCIFIYSAKKTLSGEIFLRRRICCCPSRRYGMVEDRINVLSIQLSL